MKNTKKMMTIGAAAVAALASNQVAKADAVETPVTAPETTQVKAQAQTETVETAQQAITQAETAAKATTAEVATQENAVKNAQATVAGAETELKSTEDAITTVKEAHAYSSDEGLKFLADETAKSEENLKTRTENAKNAEDALKEAQTQEASAQDKSKDAQSAVSAQEQALQTAKNAEAKAQKALDETSPARVAQAVTEAEAKEKAAATQVTAAETALKNAQAKDTTRAQNVENAKTALETSKRENGVSDAEKKLADATAEVSSKEQALTTAKSNATTAANKLATAKTDLEAAQKNTSASAREQKALRDIAISKTVITEEYAKKDPRDLQWFRDNEEELRFDIQNDIFEMFPDDLSEMVDFRNLTAAQEKELAEFTIQALNAIRKDYWKKRDGSDREDIELHTDLQAIARQMAKTYRGLSYYNTNLTNAQAHDNELLKEFHVSGETASAISPTNTMFDAKREIIVHLRDMLFADTHRDNNNVHMMTLLYGDTIANNVAIMFRDGAFNFMIFDKGYGSKETSSDYINTHAELLASVKSSASTAKEEAAVKSAETAKAQADAQVKAAESALATAKFAQNKVQEAVNAATNKVAQLERAYQAALAVKEETPQAQARVTETKKALEAAKAEVKTATDARDNFAQTLATRKQALKDAQAKVAQETASLKPLLEKAIQAEKEAQAKTEARKSAEQAVLRAQMMLSKAQEYLKAKKTFEARAIASKEELPKLEAQKAAIEAKIKDAKVALEAALKKLATAKEADAKAQADYQVALKRYEELRREKEIMDSLKKQFNVKPGRNGETTATPKDAPTQEELPEFHPEVAPTRPQVRPTTYGNVTATPTRPQVGARTYGNGQAPSGAGQATPQADKPSYSRVASRHGLPQTGDKGSALAGLGILGLLIGLGYKRRQESR